MGAPLWLIDPFSLLRVCNGTKIRTNFFFLKLPFLVTCRLWTQRKKGDKSCHLSQMLAICQPGGSARALDSLRNRWRWTGGVDTWRTVADAVPSWTAIRAWVNRTSRGSGFASLQTSCSCCHWIVDLASEMRGRKKREMLFNVVSVVLGRKSIFIVYC